MAQNDTISSLVAIIANSAKVIESSYKATEKPYVPSLNDIEPHPLDQDVSTLQLKSASHALEGACAQLCATLIKPNSTLLNKFMHIYFSASLATALNAKVPDVIGWEATGMHVSEIAAKTGIEERKLARVLRLLVAHHVFTEVSDGVFANNRLSVHLRESNPLSSLGLQFSDENYKATGHLRETLLDPKVGASYSPRETAFNRYMAPWDGTFFEWYGAAGAAYGARFGRGMIGFNEANESLAVLKHFPWDQLPAGTTVSDVGSGVGHISMELAKINPGLKLKLHDRQERVDQARTELWPKECPEALAEGRVEFIGFDFVNDSPAFGSDIYFIKHIIHNWPDAESISILSNVRKAMGPNSRVLVHEHILQNSVRLPEEESIFSQAPEPLLANYGAGKIRQYNIDINMLALFNAQERTLDEHIKLGKAAGLEFAKFWDLGEMGLVEFRLPRA